MTPTMTRHALPDGANRYTRDSDGAVLGLLKPMVGRAQGGERWHLGVAIALWRSPTFTPPKVLWHSWEAAEYALLSAVIESAAHEAAKAPPPPADPPAFRAVFFGQAWMNDHAIPVDDGCFEYTVTQAEVEAAGGLSPDSDLDTDDLEPDRGEWDALAQAANAPAEVRDWSGPFEIELHTLE